MPEYWKILSEADEASYKVLDVSSVKAVSPRTKKVYDFVILKSSPWVNIIPITSEGNVVMIRQYRHGIRDITLEIPGGLVEPKDDPKQAALRELKEETGYYTNEVYSLGYVHPNPAIFNNVCHTFLALNVKRVSDQEQDEKEDIEVVCIPLKQVPYLIQEAKITHALVVVAFYRLFLEARHLIKLSFLPF